MIARYTSRDILRQVLAQPGIESEAVLTREVVQSLADELDELHVLVAHARELALAIADENSPIPGPAHPVIQMILATTGNMVLAHE